MASRRLLTLFTLLALAAPAALGAEPVSAPAQDPQEVIKQMADRIRVLESGMARLQAQAGESWLNEQRAEEVKALIGEVLADADTRASLQGDGLTAGHNGNAFFLASTDGKFLLNVGGQIQVRYIVNNRDSGDDDEEEESSSSIDEMESGFQLRRVKLSFGGYIGDPKLEYMIQLAGNRDSLIDELEDAWIAYSFDPNLKIQAGRFMNYFAREQMTSSKRQLAVDRSIVANIFGANDGYVEGVALLWNVAPDWLKLSFVVNDGHNSGTAGGGNTGFRNGGNDFHVDASDVAFTGRADVKLAGAWGSGNDFSTWKSAEGLQAFIGAGAHYEIGETGDGNASATTPQVGPYDSFLIWTIDGLVEIAGLAVSGGIFGWHVQGTDGNVLGDTDHYGATIQAGYMVIQDVLEPFARYEWIAVDDDITSEDEVNAFTVGANYYIRGHNAKFTGDFVYVDGTLNSSSTLGTGLTGIGLLDDVDDQDGQWALRLQFQLLF